MVPFSFADQEWRLSRSGALYWEREQALLVADLHLEKGSFFARFGRMIPPYDSRETLERLEAARAETGARRVFCLGDSFHDPSGPQRIEPQAARQLARLIKTGDWVWITGNHDADAAHGLGGTCLPEVNLAGIALRHEARAGVSAYEISGHFHPKLRLRVRGRHIVRPCAVLSEKRMILPAFGSFAGGMDAAAPAILSALQPASEIAAVLVAGGHAARYPLWRCVSSGEAIATARRGGFA